MESYLQGPAILLVWQCEEKLELLPEFFELESAIAGSNELLDFSSYTAVGEHDHFFTKAMQEGREVHKMKLSASYAQIKVSSVR